MTVNKKCHNRGMTLLGFIFSLFLIFSNHSYAATVFLPDAQNEERVGSLLIPPVVSVDSVQCEAIGYTYYSSGQCPAYHNQDTCVFSDMYLKCDAEGWCRDNAYTITSCSSPKYLDVKCPNNLSLYKKCTCPSEYKYSCTGTGYSSGSGTVCDGKYTKCNCSTYYSWNGSACAHVHSYVCPSGYSESSSGMIEPVSTSKVCQLSGCSSTSGTCYKEGHSHSYSCPSGSYASSSSCSYGTSGTTSKVCSCGATSGTCYKCKSCTSSASNYCWVHSTCHGDCCSDGTYEPCDEICGGSGCSTSGSSSSSSGGTGSSSSGACGSRRECSDGSCASSYGVCPEDCDYSQRYNAAGRCACSLVVVDGACCGYSDSGCCVAMHPTTCTSGGYCIINTNECEQRI